MTDKQRRVVKAVKVLGPIRPHDLAKRLGYKESAPIMQQLLALRKNTLVSKTGKGKSTKYDLNDKFRT